jgi:hypothetical protein
MMKEETASSAVGIAEYLKLTMDSMHTKLNVLFVAMFTEQMDQTCLKGDALSVRTEPQGLSTGKL